MSRSMAAAEMLATITTTTAIMQTTTTTIGTVRPPPTGAAAGPRERPDNPAGVAAVGLEVYTFLELLNHCYYELNCVPMFNANNNTRGGTICPNCGSTDIEQHEASGNSVCVNCGVVVEENNIVSSVEFIEGAGGSSSMVGQFIGPNSSKAFTGGGARGAGMGMGGRYGYSRDSRETTLANGRRRIQDVASRMRLGHHFVDSAHRLFSVAVERNFVQGRRTTHVVAACLYIACRQEKSQHMLIDFSDALQVNVYTLGTCFLKFRRLLGLKLEIIDPALYVYRFAAHLDLDEKANAVALTSIRLVGRMRRDWIVAGRRPAGICAAALLIACRAHGFDRGREDVTKVLRVCGMTVTNRLREFEATPAAQLTMDQFHTVEIEGEADPPSLTRNRLMEARAMAIQENNVELLTSGALDDPLSSKRKSRWRDVKPTTKKAQMSQLYEGIEAEMVQHAEETEEEMRVSSAGAASGGCEGEDEDDEGSGKAEGSAQRPQPPSTASTQDSAEPCQGANDDNGALSVGPASTEIVPVINYPKKNGVALMLPNQATAEELQAPTQPSEDKINLSEWKLDMPQSAMEEIDLLFRDDEEVRQKEAVFNRLNKDYIANQKRKESERKNAEAASKDLEEEEAAQLEGKAKYASQRAKRRKKGDGDYPTTEEALLAAVSTRKISRKINYEAMRDIFDEEGSFDTHLLEDKTGPGPGAKYDSALDPMF